MFILKGLKTLQNVSIIIRIIFRELVCSLLKSLILKFVKNVKSQCGDAAASLERYFTVGVKVALLHKRLSCVATYCTYIHTYIHTLCVLVITNRSRSWQKWKVCRSGYGSIHLCQKTCLGWQHVFLLQV